MVYGKNQYHRSWRLPMKISSAFSPATLASVKAKPQDPEFLETYIKKKPGFIGGLLDAVSTSDVAQRINSLGSIGVGLKALPGVAYPTIVGATAWEKSVLLDQLDRLPLKHVSQTATIVVSDNLVHPWYGRPVGGYAVPLGFTSAVNLARGRGSADWLRDVVSHEVGHVADFSEKSPLWFLGTSRKGAFGEGPFVSEYAKTNRLEDFADSYEEFHRRPDRLQQVSPAKFERITEATRPGLLESLLDRKEFRESGKVLGDWGSGSALLRQSAEGLTAFSTALQVGHGVAQWFASPHTRTPEGHASGILSAASGVVLMSGLAPLIGIGLQGAQTALRNAIAGSRLTPEEVEATVSIPVRPLEAVLGVPIAPLQRSHRPLKVTAVAAGGAVGGISGALAGPYLGTLVGYHLGGGVGGAIGFVLGGLGGFVGGSYLGGRLGDALT